MKKILVILVAVAMSATMTTAVTAAGPEDKKPDMQVNVPVTVNQPEEVDVTVKQEEDAPPLRVEVAPIREPIPVRDTTDRSWCARNPGWCAAVIVGATGVATGATLGIIDACGGFDNNVTSNR